MAQLRERGLGRILCEGGPSLFGAALAADVVDELCITIAPTLEAGDARRIAHGETPPRGMRLVEVLRSGETLLLRYRALLNRGQASNGFGPSSSMSCCTFT